jgi:hypothetical protein
MAKKGKMIQPDNHMVKGDIADIADIAGSTFHLFIFYFHSSDLTHTTTHIILIILGMDMDTAEDIRQLSSAKGLLLEGIKK